MIIFSSTYSYETAKTYTILHTNPESTVFASIQNIWRAIFGFLWFRLVAANDRFGVAPASDEDLNDWLTVVW